MSNRENEMQDYSLRQVNNDDTHAKFSYEYEGHDNHGQLAASYVYNQQPQDAANYNEII